MKLVMKFGGVSVSDGEKVKKVFARIEAASDSDADLKPFLDAGVASLERKSGYRRAFYPGPPGGPRVLLLCQ